MSGGGGGTRETERQCVRMFERAGKRESVRKQG